MADMRKRRFKVGGEGSMDEKIERLQKELEVFSGGAPEIMEDTGTERKEYRRRPIERSTEIPLKDKEPKQIDHRKEYVYPARKKQVFAVFGFLKDSRFYIAVFGIVSFTFLLVKTPVFRYTTPFRPDVDFPQIEVGFRYYNNIFGVQTKSETVINIGTERVTLPVSMSRWMNTGKDKKLYIIKYYTKKGAFYLNPENKSVSLINSVIYNPS